MKDWIVSALKRYMDEVMLVRRCLWATFYTANRCGKISIYTANYPFTPPFACNG